MDGSTAYLKNLSSYVESNPFLAIHNQQKAMVTSTKQAFQSQTITVPGQKKTDLAPANNILQRLNQFLDVDLQENYRTQALTFEQMLPHLDFGLGAYKSKLRLQLESFLYDDVLQFEYGPMTDWFDDLNRISQKSYKPD